MSRRATLIQIFARNVKRYRLEAELTQEELAARADLHRTYVGSVERAERNVSLRAIEQLADALGVAPRRLLEEHARTRTSHRP